MSKHFVRLLFEESFDERAAFEAQMRGYRSHVWVELSDGSRHRVTFYDPVRLQQTLDDERATGRPYFAEPGLIALPEVTRENMEAAARGLAEEGFFDPIVEPPDMSPSIQSPMRGMGVDEATVRKLVTWWTTRDVPLQDGVLASDFLYVSEVGTLGLSDFLLRVANQEPWDRADVLSVVTDARHAVVVFEGSDPVTSLDHRVGWFAEHRDGQIRKIVAVDVVGGCRC